EEYLHHMQEQDADHEARSPEMHRTQEPAGGRVVIERLQAIPGASGRRDVGESEADAGDDLQQEQHERDAAEDVQPARGRARRAAPAHLADRSGQLQAAVDPGADRAQRAHYADSDSVGSRPAKMASAPFSIL